MTGSDGRVDWDDLRGKRRTEEERLARRVDGAVPLEVR